MRVTFALVALSVAFLAGCGSDSDGSKGSGKDGGLSDPDGASPGGGSGGGGSGGAGSGGAPKGSGGAPKGTGGTPEGSGGEATAAGGGPSDAGTGDGGGGGGDGGSSDFPDESTTGPDLSKCAGGVLEKYDGPDPFRPETGETVSCMEFENTSIYIPAEVSNVTIENCRFVTTEDLFVNVQGANVTVQDSSFEGPAGTWIRNSYEGHDLVVRRNEFTGMGNAVEFNVGSEIIEGNYIHDFGTADPEQHADGLQTNGTRNAVIRNNVVLLNNDVAGPTSAIAIFGGSDILVEHNKVAGGGYTVHAAGDGSSGVRWIDNCFSTVFFPGEARSGEYAPWYPTGIPDDLVRTGNTWCDGPDAGEPLDDNP